MPSFIEAVRLGVDVIEFDVLTTLDGVVICHHDPLIEETGKSRSDASPQTSEKRTAKVRVGVSPQQRFASVAWLHSSSVRCGGVNARHETVNLHHRCLFLEPIKKLPAQDADPISGPPPFQRPLPPPKPVAETQQASGSKT